MANVIDANVPNTSEQDKRQSITIDLYFGIFFDGTNNNKVQSMMGQFYRREQIYKKHAKDLKKHGINSFEAFLTLDRNQAGDLMTGDEKKIFTVSELDRIYGSATTADASFDKTTVADNDDYNWSSLSQDTRIQESDGFFKKIGKGELSKRLDQMADPTQKRGFFEQSLMPGRKSGMFSFAQGANYTNPAILSSIYKTSTKQDEQQDGDKREFHHQLYIEGSGSDTVMTTTGRLGEMKSEVWGLGFGAGGTGVTAKCRRIAGRIKTICEKYQTQAGVEEIHVHFDIYGFSRGATSARVLTYAINPDQAYQISKADFEMITGSAKFLPMHKEDSNSKIIDKNVRTLGIFDTVASIGVLRDPLNIVVSETIKLKDEDEFKKWKKSIYHDCNVDDFGLYATEKADAVLHLCALDENRVNFSLVDIQNSLGNGTEIFMPGCHADIGGGCGFGLDNFKIINCEATANSGEVLANMVEKIKLAVEIGTETYKAVKSAMTMVESVKDVVEGIEASTSVAGALVGIPSALAATVKTYDSAKGIIDHSNTAAHRLCDMLIQTNDEVPDDIKNAGGSKSDVAKDGDAKGGDSGGHLLKNLLGDSREIAEGVKEVMGTYKSGKSAYENVSEFIDQADDIDSASDVVDLFKKGKEAVSGTVDTIKGAMKAGESCKKMGEGIGHAIEHIKQRINDPNATVIGDINEGVSDLLDDMKQSLDKSLDTCKAIGDLFTEEKKPFLVEPIRKDVVFYNYYPCADKTSTGTLLLPVNVDSMNALGWIGDHTTPTEEKTWNGRAKQEVIDRGETIIINKTKIFGNWERENIGLYKYAAPGYSNLPLKLMQQWACMKAAQAFDEIPPQFSTIPNDLQSFYESLKGKVMSIGRHFCVPKYDAEYRRLRCKYLHFSMNEQMASAADNELVNGPSFIFDKEKAIIARRIYKGEKSSDTAGNGDFKPKKSAYMFDYNEDPSPISCHVSGADIAEKKPEPEVTPATEADPTAPQIHDGMFKDSGIVGVSNRK